MACVYTYKGKEYSEKEFKAMLSEKMLGKEATINQAVKSLTNETISKPTEQQTTKGNDKKSNESPIRKKRGYTQSPKFKAASKVESHDARTQVLQYFINGGKIHESVMQKMFGGHARRDKNVRAERKAREGYLSKEGKPKNDKTSPVETLAEYLHESNPYKDHEGEQSNTVSDYIDAIESVILEHHTRTSMADEIIDSHYGGDYKMTPEERQYHEYVQQYGDEMPNSDLVEESANDLDEMSDKEIQKVADETDDFEVPFQKTFTASDNKGLKEEVDRQLGTKKKIASQVNKVFDALKIIAPNLKITLHDTKDSFGEVADNLGVDSDASALYDRGDKHIHINLSEAVGHSLLHEAIHPVLDAVLHSNPKLLDTLYNQLGAKLKDVEGSPIEFSKKYAGKTEEETKRIQKVEALTEFFAKYADGNYRGFTDKVREVISDILTKLGFSPNIINVNNEADLMSLARKLSYSLSNGVGIDASPETKSAGAWLQLGKEREESVGNENDRTYAMKLLGMYDSAKGYFATSGKTFEQALKDLPIGLRNQLGEQALKDAFERKVKGVEDFGWDIPKEKAIDGSFNQMARSVAKNLVERAEGLPNHVRESIKAWDEYFYTQQSNERSMAMVNSLISELGGIEKAVEHASNTSNAMTPTMRVGIFGHALNHFAELEQAYPEQGEKFSSEWANAQDKKDVYDAQMTTIAKRLSALGTDYGRAIQYFSKIYKQSGLGIVKKIESDLNKNIKNQENQTWGETQKTIKQHVDAIASEMKATLEKVGSDLKEAMDTNKALSDKIGALEKKLNEKIQVRSRENRKKKLSSIKVDVSDLLNDSGAQAQKSKKSLPDLVNEAVNRIQKGSNMPKDIADAIKYVRNGEAYDKLSDASKKIVEDRIYQAFESQFPNEVKLGKAEGAAREEIKQVNLKKLINSHFSKTEEAAQSIANKLMNDYGLTYGEAQNFEKEILGTIKKTISDKVEGKLKAALKESKAKNTETNDVIDKFIALFAHNDHAPIDELRKILGTKFGLRTNLTADEVNRIKALSKAVNQTDGITRIHAQKELAQLVTNLYQDGGHSFIRTFISLRYLGMLSGPTTQLINGVTAFGNYVAQPMRDLVNPELWYAAYKNKDINMVDRTVGAALSSFKFGASDSAMKASYVFKQGGVAPKDVENIIAANAFSVDPLERRKYDDKYAFKGGKYNPYNYGKYVFRALLGADTFNTMLNFNRELYIKLSEQGRNQGLSGKELRTQVDNQIAGFHLTADERDAIQTKVDREFNDYERLVGKPMPEKARTIRERELILEKLLSPSENIELMDLARDNTYNLQRTGLIGKTAKVVGGLANKTDAGALLLKNYIPFTGVVGNIGEFMLDSTPIYGVLRANGYSVTGTWARAHDAVKSQEGWNIFQQGKFGEIAGNFGDAFNPNKIAQNSAQQGARGTKAYYNQAGRSYLATAIFGGLAMLLASDDDFWITGKEPTNKDYGAERKNYRPAYSFGYKNAKYSFNYLQHPELAVPMAILGNYNDILQETNDVQESRSKAGVLMLAMQRSGNIMLDQTYLQGVRRLVNDSKLAIEAMFSDEKPSKENQHLSFLQKEGISITLGQAASVLPQNNNMLKQIEQVFDPRTYAKGDYSTMFAYCMGIQHFQAAAGSDKAIPMVDIFGNEVKGLPGDNGINFSYYFGVKGEENDTYKYSKFLADHNAFPQRIPQSLQRQFVDPEDKHTYYGYLSEKNLHNLSVESGKLFQSKLDKIIDKYTGDNTTFTLNNGKEVTAVQYMVSKAWTESKTEAMFNLGLITDNPEEGRKERGDEKKSALKGAGF